MVDDLANGEWPMANGGVHSPLTIRHSPGDVGLRWDD
jgi:hypothetical protein